MAQDIATPGAGRAGIKCVMGVPFGIPLNKEILFQLHDFCLFHFLSTVHASEFLEKLHPLKKSTKVDFGYNAPWSLKRLVHKPRRNERRTPRALDGT